jgi:hypothetical protein
VGFLLPCEKIHLWASAPKPRFRKSKAEMRQIKKGKLWPTVTIIAREKKGQFKKAI